MSAQTVEVGLCLAARRMWHARARLGVRPVKALFDLLRGPGGASRAAGARFASLLVVAVDGTFLDVPDNLRTRAHLGKGSHQYTSNGYPQVWSPHCWARRSSARRSPTTE